MNDRININLDLSREVYGQIEEMARTSAVDTSEIFRRALALLIAARSGKKEGKHLGFADQVENLETELVGF